MYFMSERAAQAGSAAGASSRQSVRALGPSHWFSVSKGRWAIAVCPVLSSGTIHAQGYLKPPMSRFAVFSR